METNLNETQKQYVQFLYNSASSLLGLIDDVLDFSKIEAGKLELNPVKTNLIELIKQTVDIVIYKINEKGLVFLLNTSPELPEFIWTDAGKLKQVLINLLSNAVKFTEKGEIELKVETCQIDDNENNMVFSFSVRDTGIGISEDKQSKIFEAFSQVDSSTTRKYRGTGLGLTISSKLLTIMGSQLNVESQTGKGSRFYFTVTFPIEHGKSVDMKAFLRFHSFEENREIKIESFDMLEFHYTIVIAEDDMINMMLRDCKEITITKN
jgi:signal transduction histidine kinase